MRRVRRREAFNTGGLRAGVAATAKDIAVQEQIEDLSRMMSLTSDGIELVTDERNRTRKMRRARGKQSSKAVRGA